MRISVPDNEDYKNEKGKKPKYLADELKTTKSKLSESIALKDEIRDKRKSNPVILTKQDYVHSKNTE